MKHLLLSLIVLSSVGVTAQADLFVRPTAVGTSTDSYVYVDDVVLYVENDVNLQRNNNIETEGSIYLRNRAQLIQGSETARNTGNGFLSVYQRAEDSDQWTYNYWCSPVGVANATTNINSDFGVGSFYDIQIGDPDEITYSEPTLLTTNINGSSTPSLTISKRWIYIHPDGFEASTDYDKVNGANIIGPGVGFTMKGVNEFPVGGSPTDNYGEGFQYDFRGRPNTGEIVIPVVYNTTLSTGEYTLSGNPYPSALDLNHLWYDPDNAGKLESIKYWDEDKTSNSHFYHENAGGYGSWVPMGDDPDGTQPGMYSRPLFNVWNGNGDIVTGGSQGGPTGLQKRFAPIGQGFFFVPSNSGDNIHIKNEHRRFIKYGDNNSIFRRPEREGDDTTTLKDNPGNEEFVLAEKDPRVPHFRINVFFDKSHVRDMVLAFSDDATDGYDNGYDAKSPMDATSDAYFPVGQDNNKKPYVINTIPFDVQKQIPISFKLDKGFKFWLETVEEVKVSGKRAYIYDSMENTYQEITNGKSATYNLDAGTYDNRFFVVFKGDSELTAYVGETQGRAQEQVDFFQNNNLGVLEVTNPEGYNIKQALVFDMTGKLVYEQMNIGAEKNFSFPTSNLSDGVYIVKLKTTDNIDISHKTSVYNRK
ncbi:T9SS type A sorting domain-containing protein [Marixanthomonas ophiurae]|uniref:T9SS C-terminal target domain-containing protein n=1 Tax=Marixanthomonas ophiurae TaxID=387659 RepID=A0A3E1Q7C4_9FLAO|nr:T9SS type A sorting domain-containing protein [Marixanthomonas ophiurae]RFN58043.1 T9SS C-terminal target domain-containing protein [Marixanthomonas ophiurae]